MARARNIKPSFFKNELLGQADPLLGMLFISLWTLADKAGRLEDRPLRIKAETFPYRDGIDINGYLTELVALGFIDRYEVDGIKIIEVVNFTKHQTPHSTEKLSELPSKPIAEPITLNNASPSVNGHINVLIPDSSNTDSLLLIPDSLNLIPVKNHVSKKSKKVTEYSDRPDFIKFWSIYPNQDKKLPSFEIWININPPIDLIIDALAWQVKTEKWVKGFIPLPTTYLNQRLWENEKPKDWFEDWLNPNEEKEVING